jgi:hypothetical protein
VSTESNQPIIAYKGFNKDWKCRDFQYEVGKTYTHEGAVSVCSSGFHACTLPFDVWNYYAFGSPVARVKLGGSIERHKDDSKIVGAEITIEAELNLAQWIKEQVGAVVALCKDAKEAFTTGYEANAATTGYGANAATTGEWANAATTGNKANAATTGYGANAATTGYGANAATTGNGAIAASLGIEAKAKAGKGGAIVLAERTASGYLLNVRATKIGENGTKPDTWYVLKNGEFVEAA